MLLSKLVARHSARPSGWVGRYLFGRYLDRANRQINALMHDALGYDAAAKILEIGFGGGALLMQIAANLQAGRIDGVEISDEMLISLQRRIDRQGIDSKVRLQRASVESLPFENARFDYVCSAHTIYFWPELNGAMTEISRVTRSGGVLVLGYSSPQALTESGWVEHGFRAYRKDEIEQACRADHARRAATRQRAGQSRRVGHLSLRRRRPPAGLLYAGANA